MMFNTFNLQKFSSLERQLIQLLARSLSFPFILQFIGARDRLKLLLISCEASK